MCYWESRSVTPSPAVINRPHKLDISDDILNELLVNVDEPQCNCIDLAAIKSCFG